MRGRHPMHLFKIAVVCSSAIAALAYTDKTKSASATVTIEKARK
jgi:hypothetical protein